jgi:hypothetical protein
MSRVDRGICIISVLLGLSVCPAPGAAGTVYSWVDAQGVRHFSQYPPVDPNQPTETIQLDPLPAPPEPDDRLQNMRDISRDLELSRQQREEQRARNAPHASTPPPQAAPVEPSYLLPYPYPYATPYPPAYPPHRPRPRPPDRPGPEEPGHKPSRPGGGFISPGATTNP